MRRRSKSFRTFTNFLKLHLTGGKDGKRSNRNKGKLFVAGVGTLIMGIIIGGITPPFASLIADRFGISEPYIVHMGGPPNTPILEVQGLVGQSHILHITVRPVFKNLGFKSGHVANVIIAPDGLKSSPKNVSLIYLDRSEIGWFQKREIRCEFLVEVDPKLIRPQSASLTFKVYFYGSKGDQLYWEGINIEGWQKSAA